MNWPDLREEDKEEYLDNLAAGLQVDIQDACFLVVILSNTDKGHEAKYRSNLIEPTADDVLRDVATTIQETRERNKK